MVQDIYVIDNDTTLLNKLMELFREEKEYKLKRVITDEIEIALKNIPSLIIINEDTIEKNIIDLCSSMRNNEDNSITPIVVLSSKDDAEHQIEVLKQAVQYYILKPFDEKVLYYTVRNIVRLMYTNRRVSPLTGLPGNVQIQAELKKRLLNKEEFAVLYIDLDNFKAYNDLYGFLKGDEIIKFTARTILKNVNNLECSDSFVGHIGGDDFVAVIPKENYRKICEDIISEFDAEVLNYFNQKDSDRGYIEVANRKGIIEQFPITSISIGVVISEKDKFKNILEIGEVEAQVKHKAKVIFGSSYVVDKRK